MAYMTMRDGRDIYVRTIGNGPVIILLHGFGMQSLHWLPFAMPLSLKHRVIIPDLRGFGRSHATSHNQDCIVSNYAEDLADLVDHLELETFKLAGISMGALTGLKYLTHHADRVSHYLHIDQAPRCMNGRKWSWGLFGNDNKQRMARAKQLIDELMPFARARTRFSDIPQVLQAKMWFELGEFFASAMSKPLHKRLARKLYTMPGFSSKLLPMENWPVYLHCLQAYIEQDYNLLDQLAEIPTNISLIVGMKSEMYPCGGQLRIADYAPNCAIVPFEESGHTPLIDQPLKLMTELSKLASA